ncbi:MAG TPA: molybdopterin cofactor-binding domain-containing protein, partial [Stellaceae bacterium]|nr:molybdopterin cofactor-binding domain-containing protein [Stellaceae bacterium]
PGVIAVLTADDWAADGHGGVPHYANGVDHLDITKPAFGPETIRGGALPLQPPLARDRVRHVGEIVAMVVAESVAAAVDAAERIAVDYAPLPAVTDARAALAADAPLLFEGRGGNLCVAAENGDAGAVAAAFAQAHRVMRLASRNHRLMGTPLEPRGGLAAFDAAAGIGTLYSPSQGVHRHKNALVTMLGLAPERVRVVTQDVGGGFGIRSPCYPEYPLLLWAARRIGRPVKWTATRAECFLSDFQARDVLVEGALAVDRAGRFLGLTLDYVGNLGAYPVSFAVMANQLRMAAGVYDIPALHVAVRGVLTNTLPVGVYRGAGRPESTFILERLVDLAAAELGIERAELRRRNLIAALPYQSPLGHRYESGAFAANMVAALRLVDWPGFPARRDAAEARGFRAGIGLANYLESPTGFPGERADLRVDPAGRVAAVIGTQASGQGHETSFAQVVASALQIPLAEVSILFGDSDVAKSGGGSHSDRSMRLGGTVLVRASEQVIEKGRMAAARALEAAVEDIAYADGRFIVAGTDRSIGLYDVAALAPLAATAEVGQRLHAHPTGSAACEVEIDPETGATRVVRYVAVDDVGRVVNPMIVEGQVHGGIAQGLGQSLLEDCAYDPATGQLLAGSFQDYALPRADDLPAFTTAGEGLPAPSNPLGIKGAGECGTTPAPAAAIAAIADALGIPHLEMPATPERVWRALRAAQSQ